MNIFAELLTTPFWEAIEKLIDKEIDFYRDKYEDQKTITKEKSFEYVCKIQCLKKLKKSIIGQADDYSQQRADLN